MTEQSALIGTNYLAALTEYGPEVFDVIDA